MPDGTPDGMTTDTTPSFGVTDNAAKRIMVLAEHEGDTELMLRITISGGGCSGFQYHFDLDKTLNDDDKVFRNGETGVIIDEVSLDLVNGAEIDYVDDLIGSFFKIQNPNAASSCGCGTSFSI
ncbi:MAG: iron-sulfur cluster insertion protein ErpA [Magnetovibrionaceae bacterium]